jgi:hypothetical protein
MPTDSLIAIQSELADIKTILLVVSVVGGIALLFAIIRTLFDLYFDIQRLMAKHFESAADDLLKQNRLAELKAHVAERLTTHPNHEYARWYLARALYLEGDRESAQREFAVLARLCPSWRDQHIDPFLRELEGERTDAKSTDC